MVNFKIVIDILIYTKERKENCVTLELGTNLDSIPMSFPENFQIL